MPTSEKRPMVSMTMNIPDAYESAIATLQRLKLTPNRSEFIRTAVREYLMDELAYVRDLDNFSEIIAKGHPILIENKYLMENHPEIMRLLIDE